MSTPAPDTRDGRAAHIGHEVVVTGPGIDPRRRWAYLGAGVAVFLVVIFVLSRWGAEHGNEVRFGFPDKVQGVKLTMPDRAPEARDRDIETHYDQRGDGRATVVVEWLPGTGIEKALDGSAADDQIPCVTSPEVTCVAKVRDGVIRVTQRSSQERDVREFTQEFLKQRVKPDTRD